MFLVFPVGFGCFYHCKKILVWCIPSALISSRQYKAAALGAIGKDKAQQALTQLGLDDNAPVSVRVAALNYASESARRFSNMLTESNQQAVLVLVLNSGDMEVRQAGARLLGILNLPSEKIKDLILQTGTFE